VEGLITEKDGYFGRALLVCYLCIGNCERSTDMRLWTSVY
jgi:hypothetical protein